LALSEADDLAVGRGDDDLALGDGRGGRHGRGGFVFPDFLAAGEIAPVDTAVVGADEYAAAGDRRRRVVAGRFTREQPLNQARAWGPTNRRGRPLTSQAIGMLLRNQLYAGIVDVPEYGVRGNRGDFEPLISEDLFYKVQAVLSGRTPSTAPRLRAHLISRCAVSFDASRADAVATRA
jgi:hypothetical protein